MQTPVHPAWKQHSPPSLKYTAILTLFCLLCIHQGYMLCYGCARGPHCKRRLPPEYGPKQGGYGSRKVRTTVTCTIVLTVAGGRNAPASIRSSPNPRGRAVRAIDLSADQSELSRRNVLQKRKVGLTIELRWLFFFAHAQLVLSPSPQLLGDNTCTLCFTFYAPGSLKLGSIPFHLN